MHRSLFACALGAVFPVAALSAQDLAWPHPDGTTHHYRLVRVAAGISWTEAHAAAAAAGGYLATITSAAEGAAVARLVEDPENWIGDQADRAFLGPWIGGLQAPNGQEPDKGWQWAELEAFQYTNWSAGQPDNAGATNEDRIHFGGTATFPVATWGDAPRDTKLPGYVVEFSGPTVPRTLGILKREPGSFPGYTLVPPIQSGKTYLVDLDGRPVHSWTSLYSTGGSTYLLDNGNLLRCGNVGNPSAPSAGAGGIVEEFDWDGKLTWSYTLSTPTEVLHHDVKRLPNGNTLMIVWVQKSNQEALAAGRDPALLLGSVWPDEIIEVKPTGPTSGTIVWRWSTWDHLVQDFDSTKANYGDPAAHPELVDINYTPDRSPDWMHSNAIDYNPQLDQIVLSVRSFGEFWVIDHSTTMQEAAGHSGGRSGKGGDLLYRWGNPVTYRAGTAADLRLFGQHNVHWIPPGLPGAGHFLLFNNGVDRPGGNYSTADEIVPPTPDARGNYPMTGKVWGPSAAAWSYRDPDPTSFYSVYVSGAQRLPNGNTVICAGWPGVVREVDAAGAKVWEYSNPITPTGARRQGDVTLPPSRSAFRMERYAVDHPALRGRTLVPGAPLERHETVLLVEGSTAPRTAPPGGSVGFELRVAGAANRTYMLGTSATPGLIPMDYRFVRMGLDPVLELSVSGQATAVFKGYLGTLDGNGGGAARLDIPALPALRGLELLTTMVVADPQAPSGIGTISNTVLVRIGP